MLVVGLEDHMILLNAQSSDALPLPWLIGTGIVALLLIAGIKWIAAKYQDNASIKARTYFAVLPDFSPEIVHAFGHTAIAFDESTSAIAVWSKDKGAEILSAEDVGSFFVGEVRKETISRYNAMAMTAFIGEVGSKATINAHVSRVPYLILFGDESDKAIFTVGFVNTHDLEKWHGILSSGLGSAKSKETV